MKLNPWVHHTLEGFGVFNVVIGITFGSASTKIMELEQENAKLRAK